MPLLPLGNHYNLTHSRYVINLSSGKRLVLFRLPTLPSDGKKDGKVSKISSSVGGWSYYAMEAECPHAGGPMQSAHIDIEDSSYIASCPWHAYDFNVENGKSSYGIKACTFPVFVKDNEITLDFNHATDVSLSSIVPVSEQVKFKHGPRSKPEQLPSISTGTHSDHGSDATLCDWCVHILNTPDPERKIELTTTLFSNFATRESTPHPMPLGAGITPPSEPPRANLTAVKPWEMPNPGKGGTLKSRITILHALANIEQWAIDLALDICVRFASFQTEATTPQALPRTFYYDWLKVANDEAKHFSLLRARLEEMGSSFGALPVHHGLWESATATAHDLRARISIIALVHEARGLDINPLTIEKFRKGGDPESVEVLDVIHNDEITHVTTGHRWLSWICEQEGTDPVKVFRSNVMEHFKGALKGPFNREAREIAGMDGTYYENLSGKIGGGPVIAGG
ncbi:rieske [2Fe-2S] domain protein [Pseudovirgaria hyperparasitica]|uniref:Rieske [2Fe-2S] domain protein n=1 Tax=Pseudovirgaria hyperparasitica TaxID=470096 RepID=A0A6A6W1Q2_9PEZI|nr:rieske [2Fe-2S] domain protein [Pseudovirgaria hyperparasitica]KAF2756848.1 rieske [2Fe-2S] domain protein [Pseudovirgaria hyperparasitica]